MLLYLFLVSSCFVIIEGLENGLARTPPMGWLAWTKFMCQVNCEKYPKDCISENLFIDMAGELVKQGYRDAGYVHINIDDCWSKKDGRDEDNRLVPDPKRFPHGIKWLAQYMHDRGLKLGIYANYGKRTCMGFPGSQDYMKLDAETFAEWNVDMLKFDGCFNDPTTLDAVYPEMGKYVNETGKKIIYSCSWPFYIRTAAKSHPDYNAIARSCNLWRNFDDIRIEWESIVQIINFYDKNQDELAQYHGPGRWNDPDMIIIGNQGLTADQCRVQMALWSIWSAPLLMSNDLRTIKPEFRKILINRKVIGINQDPLGVMGKKVFDIGSVSVYTKRILPMNFERTEYSFAVAFFNRDSTQIKVVTVRLETIGITYSNGYDIENLFDTEEIGLKAPNDQIEVHVPPTGVVMWKATINNLPVDTDSPKIIQERSKNVQGLTFGDAHEKSFQRYLPYLVLMVVIFCLWNRRSQLRMFLRRRRLF